MLKDGSGAGSDFIGWVDLPVSYDKDEFARIQKAAKKIQSDSKALVVIGIGGSYLGARAVIELLKSPNYNMLQKSTPDIYFAGNGISSDALTEIIAMIGERDFSVNVISKSGTTTEPAIAFRIFKELLEKKYGKEGARERIYATTDKAKGALKTLATKEGYETFVVPDDVGGRYSVLTAVGLLPIAVSGIDIEKLMQGAAKEREEALAKGIESVEAQYAMSRQKLSDAGKHVEILAAYEPSFRFMAEWWKQLYGESEGKDQTGIFPASVDLTPDLHSMGQYMQEGRRMLAGDGRLLRQGQNVARCSARCGKPRRTQLSGRPRDELYQRKGHAGDQGRAHLRRRAGDGDPPAGNQRRDRRRAHLLLRVCLRRVRLYLRREPLQPAWRGGV